VPETPGALAPRLGLAEPLRPHHCDINGLEGRIGIALGLTLPEASDIRRIVVDWRGIGERD
jgi:hypothetical protein